MTHIRNVKAVIGKDILDIILQDVDAGKITMAQMDSIARHDSLPVIVEGGHRRRTKEGKGVSDRAEFQEILSDWFRESETDEGGKVHWASREAIVTKLIEIFQDRDVRCFPLAAKLKKANLVQVIADLQISPDLPVQQKKSERHYIQVVVCSVGWLYAEISKQQQTCL